MAFENLLIRAQRSIRGENIEVQLDGVIVERFSNPVTPTSNPIENGAIISDHAIIEPRIYSMDAVITDTPLGAASIGQVVDNVTNLFGDSTGSGVTRSQQAYASLVDLERQREPISVVTGLNTLDNMLITNIMPTRDKDTSNALFFTMELQEVLIVETQITERDESTLRGTERLGGAAPTNQGRQLQQNVTSQRADQSLLVRITERLGGQF